MQQIAGQMEENIAHGVKKGMRDSVKEIPVNTIKDTTQSFVKMGSGLVEGGLSSLFNEKK